MKRKETVRGGGGRKTVDQGTKLVLKYTHTYVYMYIHVLND